MELHEILLNKSNAKRNGFFQMQILKLHIAPVGVLVSGAMRKLNFKNTDDIGII